MLPLPSNTATLRLLTHYLAEVSNGYTLAAPELRRSVVTHVHDLVALVAGATRDGMALAQARGLRAAQLTAIKAYITGDLGRLDLTVESVAAHHHITPRQVQRLFETGGTTFSKFVLSQRLAWAHRLLSDPRSAGQAISSIAYTVGFGDLSYFNRAFRLRYSATPSDVRADAQRKWS
jgi:AraC-like DNA-binding protein